MDVLKAIKSRRSVREFTDEEVSQRNIVKILEAGRWAPSGKNNQPWRFKVITDPALKERLAEYTIYSKTVRNASVLIAVFLDKESSYDRTKDLQAIGACCQNMWLATHALGLGAVWNGEILNRKVAAQKALETSPSLELMALLCIGHPTDRERASVRKELDDLLL